MDNETTKKYRANGVFDYEAAVLLREKISRVMNEFASIGAELNAFDDETVIRVADDLSASFTAMIDLRKFLDKIIGDHRKNYKS